MCDDRSVSTEPSTWEPGTGPGRDDREDQGVGRTDRESLPSTRTPTRPGRDPSLEPDPSSNPPATSRPRPITPVTPSGSLVHDGYLPDSNGNIRAETARVSSSPQGHPAVRRDRVRVSRAGLRTRVRVSVGEGTQGRWGGPTVLLVVKVGTGKQTSARSKTLVGINDPPPFPRNAVLCASTPTQHLSPFPPDLPSNFF